MLVLLAMLGLAPGRTLAGSDAEPLARVCDAYGQGTLKAHPTMATALGDRAAVGVRGGRRVRVHDRVSVSEGSASSS